MLVYGDVVIDIDLGIGRQYGYHHPNRANANPSTVYVATRNPAACHPDRPHMAHGLCDRCYPYHWRTSR